MPSRAATTVAARSNASSRLAARQCKPAHERRLREGSIGVACSRCQQQWIGPNRRSLRRSRCRARAAERHARGVVDVTEEGLDQVGTGQKDFHVNTHSTQERGHAALRARNTRYKTRPRFAMDSVEGAQI
eukprot:scaffold27953_cov75-Phaeocystis_antarctica.AAC.3